MREFFQGWRRKTGLALLAMLLTMVWARSHVITNRVSFDSQDEFRSVETAGGDFIWSRTDLLVGPNQGIGCGKADSTGMTWDTRPYQPLDFKLGEDDRYSSRHEFVGAEFAVVKIKHRIGEVIVFSQRSFWVFPLIGLILPLTLFSAYLMLTK